LLRTTKGIKRLSSAERALIAVPDDVKDTLVGILLGDSFVRKVVYLGLCLFLFVPFLSDINVSLEENNILALSFILALIPGAHPQAWGGGHLLF
jgi:hypothetical protein